MRHTKWAICLLLALLLLGSLPLFSSCAPRVEDLYDRVVWLLTESQEIGEVLWGKGLPVWEKDSEFAKENHLYENAIEPDYLFVSDEAAYHSVSEIKAEAERYYAKDYLEASVYPQTFEGLAINDGMGQIAFAKPRFYEDGNWFYQYEDAENYFSAGTLTYDFSTLRVVKPSNDQTCYVTISATLDSTGETLSLRVKLVVQNDQWYLASAVG
ncbi:MAG: hypothetical protein IJR88_00360 [Clostridia bacterium]|nr:hypothetical protein [Clostridia bacterium]